MLRSVFNFVFVLILLGPTSFQFPVTPIQEGIIALHAFIMIYGIGIIAFVLAILFCIVYLFRSTRLDTSSIVVTTPVAHLEHYSFLHTLRNIKHGVNLEIVWTLAPAFILISIALPSLELLYAMDEIIEPQLTIKVGGRQWYWNYTYTDWPESMETRFFMPPKSLTLENIREWPLDAINEADQYGLLQDLSENGFLRNMKETDVKAFNLITMLISKLINNDVRTYYAPGGFDFAPSSAYDNLYATREFQLLASEPSSLQLLPFGHRNWFHPESYSQEYGQILESFANFDWELYNLLVSKMSSYRFYIGQRLASYARSQTAYINFDFDPVDRLSISGIHGLFRRYYWENLGDFEADDSLFKEITDENAYSVSNSLKLWASQADLLDKIFGPFFTFEEPNVIASPYIAKDGYTPYDRFVYYFEEYLSKRFQRSKPVRFHGSNRTYSYDSYMVAESNLRGGEPRLLKTDKPMVVPSRIHIRFLVTSNDVLHSFAIPAAGIKIDAVPGRLNQVSAYFLYEGTFFGQCSELCGVNHGFMPIEVKVLKSNEFLQWRLDHKNEGPESDYLA